jgi:hypothetical protein
VYILSAPRTLVTSIVTVVGICTLQCAYSDVVLKCLCTHDTLSLTMRFCLHDVQARVYEAFSVSKLQDGVADFNDSVST